MTNDQTSMKKFSILLLLSLTLLMLVYLAPVTPIVHATNPPTGTTFDNIVIIAMENQNYASVMGTGSYTSTSCISGPAPFIDCSLAYGSTIPNYHGGDVSGCSAACYVALTAGDTYGITDQNECATGCKTFANIISRFNSAGLTYSAYCEYDPTANPTVCERQANHFPFAAYSNSNPNDCFHAGTCANIFGGTSTSCSGHACTTADFINVANGVNPPNFLWYTPSDNNNMHDNCGSGNVMCGDTFLKNFLVGSGGSITSPALGSLLATKLFALGQRTLLVLWWDEYDPSPILFYQPSGVKPLFVSAGTGFDHYSTLKLIEDNWNLATLTANDASHSGLKDEIAPIQMASPAILSGWGAVRLDEVTQSNNTNIVSQVGININGHATNTEEVIYSLQQKGMNTIRVDFDPWCTDQVDLNDMSVYSQTNAQNVITIAQHYNFYVVFDYHGYSDIFRNTNCWLSYWSPIVQNIGPLYSKIVWEPENEPEYVDCNNSPSSCPTLTTCNGTDAGCMTYLGSAYNQWIVQARALTDTHWIIVQNLCSYTCSFTPGGDGNGIGGINGYPTVTDASSHILMSLHSYMGFNHYSQTQYGGWSNATAVSVALGYYRTVLGERTSLKWPVFNTEGGTDTLNCDPNICLPPSPDVRVLDGSAGYTKTTFNFIQTLTYLYDNGTSGRIGYAWWPAGSWTNTQGADQFGALQCGGSPKGWGCILKTATDVPLVANPASISFFCTPNIPCYPISSVISLTAIPGMYTISYSCVPTGLSNCNGKAPSISGPSSVTSPASDITTFTVTITEGTESDSWDFVLTISVGSLTIPVSEYYCAHNPCPTGP